MDLILIIQSAKIKNMLKLQYKKTLNLISPIRPIFLLFPFSTQIPISPQSPKCLVLHPVTFPNKGPVI